MNKPYSSHALSVGFVSFQYIMYGLGFISMAYFLLTPSTKMSQDIHECEGCGRNGDRRGGA